MHKSFKILHATQCISMLTCTVTCGYSGHQIKSILMWTKRRTPNVSPSSVLKFQYFWIRQCVINLRCFFISLRFGWKVNSIWLITELANQRARKALFTCVVYMYTLRPRRKGFRESWATSKTPTGIMNLKLFLHELFLYSHANKIHLHKKGFAISLVLKVRVFVIQKWPIVGKEERVGQQRTKKTVAKRLRMLRVEPFRLSLRSHFPGNVSHARLHSLLSPRFVVLLHAARSCFWPFCCFEIDCVVFSSFDVRVIR